MRVHDLLGARSLSTEAVERPGESTAKKSSVDEVSHGRGPVVELLRPGKVQPGSTPAFELQLKRLQALDPIADAGASAIDGAAHCAAVLSQIRASKRQDPTRRCVVVFDLDNTIFETRARTLLALEAYDAAHGTRHFEALGGDLQRVGKDARHTCELLGGISPEEVEQIHQFWQSWFWTGEHFLHDQIIEPVFELAWQAKAAGAEVLYLTGRIDHASSLVQLERAGLPDADASHLFCKQKGEDTGDYKSQKLGEWIDRGDFVGWFLTEGCRDIASVQAADARVPCVRLGYVHETNTEGVDPRTPLISESWTRRLRPISTEP